MILQHADELISRRPVEITTELDMKIGTFLYNANLEIVGQRAPPGDFRVRSLLGHTSWGQGPSGHLWKRMPNCIAGSMTVVWAFVPGMILFSSEGLGVARHFPICCFSPVKSEFLVT